MQINSCGLVSSSACFRLVLVSQRRRSFCTPADFTRTFGAVWFGALTCVGIYPALRDAKRLADGVGQAGSHLGTDSRNT